MAFAKLQKHTKRITILPGREFRGVRYFEHTTFDVSDSLADMYLQSGAAVLHECQK